MDHIIFSHVRSSLGSVVPSEVGISAVRYQIYSRILRVHEQTYAYNLSSHLLVRHGLCHACAKRLTVVSSAIRSPGRFGHVTQLPRKGAPPPPRPLSPPTPPPPPPPHFFLLLFFFSFFLSFIFFTVIQEIESEAGFF